ncbi:MAG: cytosine permease [Pseudomonadota bacterium]
MSRLEQLVEDYATEPVPESATYSGWRIGFVLGGIGIALPAILAGAEIGSALGYAQSALAFLVAGLLVTTLALVTGFVGMRSRLSTYMILKFAFGPVGAGFVNAAFALAQFGWFGVNAYYFGLAAESAAVSTLGLALPASAYVISGGVLMAAATVFGYKSLDKLALFAFPLMLTVLAAMLASLFSDATLAELLALDGSGDLTFAQAITVLAGGIIVGVVLVPDLTRYARGTVDVVIAVLLALALVETLIHVAAAGPALRFGVQDPLAILLRLGFGSFALLFLISASLTTNVVNLYGSALALTAIQPRLPEWVYVILAGTVGTILALFDVGAWFIDFLIWQSVIFSAVLGVYVVDFFVVRRARYELALLATLPPVSLPAFAAWITGATVAALCYLELLTLTGMANLDGALVAGGCYALFERGIASR